VASLCLQRLEPKKFPSLDWSNLQSSQTLNIINDTCPQFIQVFNVPESSAAQGKLYKVMILSNDGRPLGEFQSPVSARFLEDLNGDGIFEVVIRQYQVDPFRPVQVYRYESGQFVQDKSVESLFY
jgi:hypothetical protein